MTESASTVSGCRALVLPVLVAALALYGCSRHDAAREADAAVFPDKETEARVESLEQASAASWSRDCGLAVGRVERHQAKVDDAMEETCRLALASTDGSARAELAMRYRASVQSQSSISLTLDAALAGDGASYVDLAQQLATAAGPEDAPYAQLDGDTLSAAQAAAALGVRAGQPDAADLLRTLEDREFPLHGSKLEPLWRSLYFGRFEEIEDTEDTRRHIGGFATGLAELCSQWEPPGIRSVGWDAGLEIYLAPLRAEVPGRVWHAIPQVGRTAAQSVQDAVQGASDRSFAGFLEKGWRGIQLIKRDVNNAWAIGSTDGRDGGQRLFNETQSCRSPRGQHMIDSLVRYFRYTKDTSPLDRAPTAADAASEPPHEEPKE